MIDAISATPIPTRSTEIAFRDKATLILTCIKTGTWWRVSSPSEAMRTARDNGLVDFEFGAET